MRLSRSVRKVALMRESCSFQAWLAAMATALKSKSPGISWFMFIMALASLVGESATLAITWSPGESSNVASP